MENLYREVNRELDRIEYSSLFEGFKRYDFALSDHEKLYLKDGSRALRKEFMGDVSMDYDHGPLAICNVSDPNIDPRLLASSLVEKMFLCHELENDFFVFPNELEAFNFPRQEENYQYKYFESKAILRGLTGEEDGLIELLKLRYGRYLKYGRRLDYEFRLESLKGLSAYIGLEALKKLSTRLYIDEMKKYIELVSDFDRLFLKLGDYSRLTGLLILKLLEKYKLEIKLCQGQVLTEELFRIYRPVGKETPRAETISRKYRDYVDLIDKKFSDFNLNKLEKEEGPYKIIAFDPFNIYKKDRDLLHEHFVVLEDEKGNRLMINGESITSLDEANIDRVLYYKIII